MMKKLFFAMFTAVCLTTAEIMGGATPVKMQISKCKFSIGREHKGAKGSMSAVPDGVAMQYDFTGGGLYTGIEYYPGDNNAEQCALTFLPEQTTRFFLRIRSNGRTFNTRQRTVPGGKPVTVTIKKNEKWRSVWGGKVQDELSGGIEFIMFCVENSMHCPKTGKIIIQTVAVPGVKEVKLPDMSIRTEFVPKYGRSFLSRGMEYQGGAKAIKVDDPNGVKLHYDFSSAGRYCGIEMDLPLPYGRAFKIHFNADSPVRVFARVLDKGGFYETNPRNFQAGENLVFDVARDAKWRRMTHKDKSVKVLDGRAKRVMLCVEKSQHTPKKGELIITKVEVFGAGFPEEAAIVPAKSAPKPVYHFAGNNMNGIVDAEYHSEAKALYAPDIAMSVASAKVDPAKLDPEHFTISAWFYPRGDAGNYRTIVTKSENGTDGLKYDFQFCLYNMVPIFGFLDRRGHWQGQLRYYDDIRCGKDGKKLVPIIRCRQAIPDAWNFVAATFNKGEVRLYLNGYQVAEPCYARDTKLNFSRAPLNFGAGFDGLFDRISVFNKSLTANEVEYLRQLDIGKYSSRKHKVVSRSEELRKDHDPYFKKLLPMTAKYLENIPAEKSENSPPEFHKGVYNGAVMIFRNGKPEIATMGMPVRPVFNNRQAADNFAAAGLQYFQLNIESDAPWKEDGDYSEIDNALLDTFKNSPNARILVRYSFEAPAWYRKAYRSEADLSSSGKTSERPSLSSEVWQRDAEKALRRLLRHIDEHPVLSRRVAGYLLGGGRCGEWYWWASRFGWIDYNPKNVAQFRKFLREYYNGDVEKLRAAWQDKNVTFENANIPSPQLRGTSEDGFFRSVKKARPVADHLRYMSKVVSSTMSRFARVAKETIKTPKLIGFFSGYATWHDDLSNQGFYDFKSVLADENIDFVAAPMCYVNRRAKYAGDYMNGYQASIALHNKLYYDEADMRTCFSLEKVGYKTPTMEETRAVHFRSWGNAMTQGVNLWWMLLSGNSTFHDERIMGDIARMKSFEPEILTLDRSRVAKIAVLCDEESMHYVNAFHKQFHSYNREARERLAHIGAPIDFYLMSDLENSRMPDYKVYVFLNAFYITPEQREMIHSKLARTNAVAVWCYGSGYLSPSGNSVSTMKKLTGFDFEKLGRVDKQHLVVSDKKHPYMQDSFNTGEEFFFAPAFAVKSGEGVSALGKFGNKTVLAARKTAFGTSVYSLIPPTPELLRSICRAEKIHLYNTDGDVIRANNSCVMLHASRGGEKIVDLPWNTPSKEVVSGKIYPAGKVKINMNAGHTAIFIKQR